MKEVYIVGEDPVTIEIIRRIVKDYAPNLCIKGQLPARGSEIKSKMENFNKFSLVYPVILLSDMDTADCAPLAKSDLMKGMSPQNRNFIINIAVDEAEAWLFADTKGFAKYLGVAEKYIPKSSEQKFGGLKKRLEINVPLKSSYYLTHQVIVNSNEKELREQIYAPGKSCKGPEYNPALKPFIKEFWNIEEARKNSYSLEGMIKRIQSLCIR